MIFQKLRLIGFKSFVESSEFVFRDGLTGIVGPNGCGKSNLVEAMRWVMGESSSKNMRASGMDDVIFSGSIDHPSRNFAEVTLFLENDTFELADKFPDSHVLEVSRRIERELGSTYRINGREVRARDVQLLFTDAASGFRSKSLVRQGEISELIGAKPSVRRSIIEEAAGISGLHVRRQEAESRLKATEVNLARLDDIITQQEEQISSLRKQSKQANRYRNISSNIRQTEGMILILRWQELLKVQKVTEQKLAAAESLVNSNAKVFSKCVESETKINEKLVIQRENVKKVELEHQRLELQKKELESDEQRITEKRIDLTSRIELLNEDLRRENHLVAENSEQEKELNKEKTELIVAEQKQAGIHAKLTKKVSQAQNELQKSEKILQELTTTHAKQLARKGELENNQTDCENRIKRLESFLINIVYELTQISKETKQISKFEEKQALVKKSREDLEQAEQKAAKCEKAVLVARDLEKSSQVKFGEVDRELSVAKSEFRTLKDLLSNNLENLGTPVIDSITVEPGFEIALAVALGDDLNASTDEEATIHWGRAVPFRNDPKLPENIRSLATKVSGSKELERRLEQIGIVSQTDGLINYRLLKPGQRLVTKEGDMWRWDGFVIKADAKSPAALRLEQRNRLTNLVGIITNLEKQSNKLAQKLETSQKKIEVATKSEREARYAVIELRKIDAKAREDFALDERKLDQLKIRKDSQLEVKTRTESELAEAKRELKKLTDETTREIELEEAAKNLEQLKKEVEERSETLAHVRVQTETATQQQQVRTTRLEAIDRELAMITIRKKSNLTQIETLKSRHFDLEIELKQLRQKPKENEKQRKIVVEKISESVAELATKQNLLKQSETELISITTAKIDAQNELVTAREELIRAEERFNTAKIQLEELQTNIQESFSCEPELAIEHLGIKRMEDIPEMQVCERKLERLEVERERLGGVNLRADEEMEEILKKKNKLQEEHNDLTSAIRKLRTGISQLNTEARKRFLEAFEKVNTEFQRLFKLLFNGGSALLELVDSEDPLESGLEIIASPPGKKAQQMTLLSGGEQALTCIALIFAVFLTNPAPICVLDEVDAPLDDANVERFCDLLDEIAKRTTTRYVIITHNPITMSRMQRLFGVTMAERGISQLLSIDLENTERFLQAS